MTATEEQSGQSQSSRRRSLIVALPVLVFLALAIVFGFSLKSADPTRLPSALIGKPVPDYAFPALEGLRGADGAPVVGVSSSALATGDVTVVNFWASWCGPCIAEHPMLMALKARGVRVVGINYKDPAPGGRRFLGRYGNPFEAVGADRAGRGAIEWGVYGMPETFVIDGAGRIAYKHVGPITAESLESKIVPAIKAAGG